MKKGEGEGEGEREGCLTAFSLSSVLLFRHPCKTSVPRTAKANLPLSPLEEKGRILDCRQGVRPVGLGEQAQIQPNSLEDLSLLPLGNSSSSISFETIPLVRLEIGKRDLPGSTKQKQGRWRESDDLPLLRKEGNEADSLLSLPSVLPTQIPPPHRM